ncbi:hypothetical protein ACFY5D_16520 [Paeniglutamicibacter sp. NPDC012692]|uniref:hypothetical protein n=1 Tax=Paeniglutamicibacter sp. NPDC012692 TaxID=3364388 RepID=UPI0036982470
MPGSSAGFFARLFRKRGATTGAAAPSAHKATGASPTEGPSAGPDGKPQAGAPAGLHAASAPADSDAEVAGERLTGRPDAPAGAPGIVTVVALEPHAGLATLCAALEYRLEGRNLQVRGAGPGLMRAAFDGLLKDTDVLVLLAPAAAPATGTFREKLDWLEANDNAGLVERTVFVVNYGATEDGGALELPASLDRPVVVLPHDAALGLPAPERRAPRRAARHALDQLVAEISAIRAGS